TGKAAHAAQGDCGHLDVEALRSAMAGAVPRAGQVEMAADIRNALALRERHPKLKLIQVGASEGWKVAPEIARAGVPVIVAAFNALPHSFEMLAATRQNAARLQAAGVVVAISPDRNANIPAIGKIRQAAGVAVGHGLPWEHGL